MKKKSVAISLCVLAAVLVLAAQESDVIIKLTKGDRVAMAVPDFRGSGDAQQYMSAFNQTLWNDLDNSGLFKMVSKSLYPLQVPQRPEDFRAPLPPLPARRGGPPPQPRYQGPWLTQWSGPPASANYLAFGYTAIEAGQMVLRGWLYNVNQADLANAQVLGKIYLAPPGEEGARKLAHDFATDILGQFGGKSLVGTKIAFVRRSGRVEEIWTMDPDGGNQKQFTFYKSLSLTPAICPDGTKIAFTSYAKGNPAIFVHSLETGRRLPFYSPVSPVVTTPDFTPDGRQIVFSSSVDGWAQIFIANADGSGLHRLTYVRAVEVEPKANPKTGADIVFVSGRGGPQQIYRMNVDGTDVRMLTTGEGQASNPSWHPDGQHIAFAWTRGYAPGNFNIFVMDVGTRTYNQLTHGAGRNENPSWAPDGQHIVFSSNRSGSQQIWTMLADGTQLQQLTTQGVNTMPVWGK
ncbi:MAG: translocation protein TolB [Acidobacteria bacterium]|nr:translocation protein TolB [Acidobacteriota bacterium]